jgi:hypothetical protein
MKKILDNWLSFLLGILASVVLLIASASPALARIDPGTGGPSQNTTSASGSGSSPDKSACDNTTNTPALKKCVQNNAITKDLQLIVNVLSAGVGIIIIGMIILGGTQYSMAGDNAQAITAAKQRITNALIALAAYLFLFAFLQWLVPGGLFG